MEHTEVVFIRHHTSATEVDEQEFFYSRETGGTIVSSALILMKEIISQRFPVGEWNIYGAQASDGDNWNDDSTRCHEIPTKSLIPQVQFFSYIEITTHGHQALWREYEAIQVAFPDSFLYATNRWSGRYLSCISRVIQEENGDRMSKTV